MKISEEGISLIKRFEGCRLEAYKCSAEVLTIGYGHTGGVKEDDTITQEEADKLLKADVFKFEKNVEDNVKVELNQSQFDALVAWTLFQPFFRANNVTEIKGTTIHQFLVK